MASIAELQSLKKALGEQATGADAFASVVKECMSVLALDDGEIATAFDMSRPSVNRWRNGKASPHPAMRKHVYTFFAKKIDRLLREGSGRASSIPTRSERNLTPAE